MASGLPGMSCGRMMLPRILSRILSVQVRSALSRAAACWRAITSPIPRLRRASSPRPPGAFARASPARAAVFRMPGRASVPASAWASVWVFPLARCRAFSPAARAPARARAWAAGQAASPPRAAEAAADPTARPSRWPAASSGNARRETARRPARGARAPKAPRRGPSPAAAGCHTRHTPRSPRSLGELHLEADLGHALLAQLVHHLQHRLVPRILVAADERGKLGVLAAHFLDRRGQLSARHGALADDDAC